MILIRKAISAKEKEADNSQVALWVCSQAWPGGCPVQDAPLLSLLFLRNCCGLHSSLKLVDDEAVLHTEKEDFEEGGVNNIEVAVNGQSQHAHQKKAHTELMNFHGFDYHFSKWRIFVNAVNWRDFFKTTHTNVNKLLKWRARARIFKNNNKSLTGFESLFFLGFHHNFQRLMSALDED